MHTRSIALPYFPAALLVLPRFLCRALFALLGGAVGVSERLEVALEPRVKAGVIFELERGAFRRERRGHQDRQKKRDAVPYVHTRP